MNDQLIKDYEEHGYDVVETAPGVIVFETTKEKYRDRKNPKIHKDHPIFFDDDKKNIKGNGSLSIIKFICARCNAPIDNGKCLSCGAEIATATKKKHIPWKHELANK